MRTSGAIVTSGGTADPSTEQVTVSVSWPQSATPSVLTFYLIRSRNYVIDQTDWSGGMGQNGPITSPNSKFASSTDIDYSSAPGSIKIKFQ